MASVLSLMLTEMADASTRYGPFRSSHEGLGVLTEEYHELVEAVRANDLLAIRREAIQISAVAYRLADCCDVPSFAERSIP